MTENKIRKLIRDELRKIFDKSSELISKQDDNRKSGEIIEKKVSKNDGSLINPKKDNRKKD